ncbi:uncharacterized protein LOC104900174 [Beta vulgaris subsp. vulgaris]|uniref:uncharacterized protein LOC104900174 n=1 Tax=Beta vulgaris subsp. vulgaris TaxID=3555 RepID=UPI002036B90C|nr:uncharacterized protein LOC104900174 [Beta vulgaris subsp. vulgaris]
MEDIDCFWTFHESFDELKQKLQYVTYELEITRKETNEEIRKNNDDIKKLLQLLQTTCKERDEAKIQLKKLQQIMSFNKPNNVITDHIIPTTFTTPFSPDSPLLTTNFPTKTNSSITESSSFSLETHTTTNNNNNNNNNIVSSPAISSPDSSNIVFSTKQTTKIVDQQSLIIANLAKGRALPPKGKLLQAVIEAGPLLSTLMVAGSLPQWRNPPGLLTHQIPPVNLKGCGGIVTSHSSENTKFCTSQQSQSSNVAPNLYSGTGVMCHTKQVVRPDVVTSSFVKGLGNSGMCNNGLFGIYPSPMLDFGSGSSGSCLMGGRLMINSGASFDCQNPKRQRII